jgi:hypothetical protein
MNDEKIKSLVNAIIGYKNEETLLLMITRWFEKNPIEPIVTGLSDEQVSQFAFRYYESPIPVRVDIALTNYLKTQTFTQPEVKEVAVGLSDDLLWELVKHFDIEHLGDSISNWLKTKTFTPPNNEGNVYTADGSVLDYKKDYFAVADKFLFLEEEYSKLKAQRSEDYDELLKSCSAYRDELIELKSQQFEPNWDDAPENAVFCDVVFRFFDDYAKPVHDEPLLITSTRPTPPEPVVEVGMYWKLKNQQSSSVFKVISIGSFNVGNEECNGVSVFGDGTTYFYSINDFIAKFEQVKS